MEGGKGGRKEEEEDLNQIAYMPAFGLTCPHSGLQLTPAFGLTVHARIREYTCVGTHVLVISDRLLACIRRPTGPGNSPFEISSPSKHHAAILPRHLSMISSETLF